MAYDETAKYQTAGLSGTAQGQVGAAAGILGAQYDAQFTYRRTQAMQVALQANNGAPRKVSELIADADLILAWLEPKPPASN